MIKQEDYLGKYPYKNYVDAYNEAWTHNHPHWLGDIPVPQHLLKFVNEFRHKRQDAVIRIEKRGAYYNGKGYRVFAELGIAFKDAPDLLCGSLSIEAGNAADEIQYVVTSDRIENDKFASHSDGYHRKQTKDFVKAVKTALQYVKATPFEELRQNLGTRCHDALSAIRTPAYDKLYSAASISRQPVLDEVSNMIRMGYKPVTPNFKAAVDLIVNEGAELNATANYKPRPCFVWAKPDRVEYQIEGNEKVIVYDLQHVPEEIRNKVSVLQIGNENQPIRDVGVKVSPTMYWLFL